MLNLRRLWCLLILMYETDESMEHSSEHNSFLTFTTNRTAERSFDKSNIRPLRQIGTLCINDSGSAISRTLFDTCKDSNKGNIPRIYTPEKFLKTQSMMALSGSMKDILENDAERSLELLLTYLLLEDRRECDIIVAFDRSFQGSQILRGLLSLPHLKQVVSMESLSNLEMISWRSSKCLWCLFLLSNVSPLIEFANKDMEFWNFYSRVMIAGLDKEDVERIIHTKKGKKTEHVVGIIKGDSPEHFKIYANELYWGHGLMPVGTWRKGVFIGDTKDVFPDKISNLRRAVLTVINFEWPPSVMHSKDKEGNIVLRYGCDVAVVEALSQAFNFTLAFKESGSGEYWGERLPNGSWNGLVGLLGTGEGDLGIANIYITALMGRREFQEFSTPFIDDESCFITNVEPPLPRWHSPGLPFQMSTWMAIFLGLFLSGPVLYILTNLFTTNKRKPSKLLSLMSSILYAYGVHFKQPIVSLPQRGRTRVFVAFFWIYAIILVTGYCSNLTAFLTVSRKPASMETFQELYASERPVDTLGPFFRNSMEQSGNKYLNALATERSKVLFSFEDIKTDVLAGRAVNINSRRYVEFLIVQLTTSQGSPVRIMKECFAPYTVAVAYQSNSPLKPLFDQMINYIFESGLVSQWTVNSFRFYQHLKNEEAKADPNEPDTGSVIKGPDGVIPLGTDHMEGVFILLAFGYFLSWLVFVLEVCYGLGILSYN